MTDKEILQKVIDKLPENFSDFYKKINLDIYEINGLYLYEIDGWEVIHLRDLIYNHDFAKEFFGERAKKTQIMSYVDFHNNVCNIPKWKHHLQQMVLEEDPLKYLEKFL